MSNYNEVARRILDSDWLERRRQKSRQSVEYLYFVPLLHYEEHFHLENVRFGFSSDNDGKLYFPGTYIPQQIFHYPLTVNILTAFMKNVVSKGNEYEHLVFYEGNRVTNPIVHGLRGDHTICLMTLKKSKDGSFENFLTYSEMFDDVWKEQINFANIQAALDLATNYIRSIGA